MRNECIRMRVYMDGWDGVYGVDEEERKREKIVI